MTTTLFPRKWSHLDLLKSQLHATPTNISHRDNNYVDIESPVNNPYYTSNDYIQILYFEN